MMPAPLQSKPAPLVFIVDDDPTVVRMISSILTRTGYKTSCAGDVSGALDGIRRLRPDLVLLDIYLADGSGLDVCRAIQTGEYISSTPVLFISADNDTTTKVRGFEAGGVDFITKPIVGAELIARVRTHLRLRAAYERLSELQAERVQRLAMAQQNLMPSPEDFPEARFGVYLKQVCAAGGDFYDVIPSGECTVDYIVADASGHDLAASYWTAALKALAAEYATPFNVPLDIVRAINTSLCRFLPSGAFFTLIYVRLNRQTGRLSMINAGHPPAIIVRADGSEPVIVQQEGDVVGAFKDAFFGVAELTLDPHDRLFLYSDGVIESDCPHGDGPLRLAAICRAKKILPLGEIVSVAVQEMVGDNLLRDDTLLLGVER